MSVLVTRLPIRVTCSLFSGHRTKTNGRYNGHASENKGRASENKGRASEIKGHMFWKIRVHFSEIKGHIFGK